MTAGPNEAQNDLGARPAVLHHTATHKLGKSGHWIRKLGKLGRSGILRPVFGLQTA